MIAVDMIHKMNVEVLPAALNSTSEIKILEKKVANFVNDWSTSKRNQDLFEFKVPEIPKMKKEYFPGQMEINNNEETKLEWKSFCKRESDVVEYIKEKMIFPEYNGNAMGCDTVNLFDEEICIENIQLRSTIDAKKVIDEFFEYGIERLESDHESGRLYVKRLEFLITQQKNNSEKIRNEMYNHIRRKAADLFNEKNKYFCLFVGNLASNYLINQKMIRKCFYILILNKTKQDMKCLLKLAKGYSRSWMKEFPDLGESFVEIIFERIYGERLQKKLERHICEIFLQTKFETLPMESKKTVFDLSKNCQILQPHCPVTIRKMAVLQYSTAINSPDS